MRLSGIEVWDGVRRIGPSEVEWTRDGTDATFERVAPSARAPEFEGLTLIPGLIDTHVHLMGYAGTGSPDFMTWPLLTPREEQVLHGLAHAQRALRGGVTTLRDLASDEAQLGLRAAADEAVVVAPRILAYGVVGMTAGHHDLFTPPSYPIRGRTADGPDECRKLVRTYARMGMDGVKIATGGGVLSQGDRNERRNYGPDELETIVDEAHALDLRVAAHAHTEQAIAAALRHGVDSVEHGTLTSLEQARTMIQAGVRVAPTLLINDAIAQRRVPVSDEAAEKARALVSRRDELLAAAAREGLDFVLGTDANGFHVQFGDEMAEVRAMAALFGWSAERALVSATSAAAEAVGREGRIGSIVPGAAADFVLMRGDPTRDIGDLTTANIVAVVSRGSVVAGELPG